jgi:hypothetical protein
MAFTSFGLHPDLLRGIKELGDEAELLESDSW